MNYQKWEEEKLEHQNAGVSGTIFTENLTICKECSCWYLLWLRKMEPLIWLSWKWYLLFSCTSQSGIYTTPGWLSDESKEIISQLLKVDPKKRISIQDLLRHPWLTKSFNVPIEWESKYKVDMSFWNVAWFFAFVTTEYLID